MSVRNINIGSGSSQVSNAIPTQRVNSQEPSLKSVYPAGSSLAHQQIGTQQHLIFAWDTANTASVLVDNARDIAGKFCAKETSEKINTEVKNQINYLKTITFLLELYVNSNFKDAKDDFKANLIRALAEINEFLLRFNNDCVGGINKSTTGNKLKALEVIVSEDVKKCQKALNELEIVEKEIEKLKKVFQHPLQVKCSTLRIN